MKDPLDVLQRIMRLHRYPTYVRLAWWRHVTPRLLRAKGVQVGKRVMFYGSPIVEGCEKGAIVIGENSALCSISRWTALGVNHPVVLRLLRPDARLTIGPRCGISGASICAAVEVELGEEVMLGANVTIADTDFHALEPRGRRFNKNPEAIGSAPVRIQDNVFVGTGAYILKGVTIGANSVVGAGSVVTSSIPADVIAAGNPARVIRRLSEE